MKVLKILSVSAFIVQFASTGWTANYDDLVAQGYRWVTVDGPYACVSKEDLWRIAKSHDTDTGLQLIKNQRAYCLLQGDIVKVIQEDATSGMSLIRVPGIAKDLWTLTKFLSKRPIENAFGVIETPETSGLILAGITQFQGTVAPSGVAPAPGASSTPN
jgi:hypothetical protein